VAPTVLQLVAYAVGIHGTCSTVRSSVVIAQQCCQSYGESEECENEWVAQSLILHISCFA